MVLGLVFGVLAGLFAQNAGADSLSSLQQFCLRANTFRCDAVADWDLRLVDPLTKRSKKRHDDAAQAIEKTPRIYVLTGVFDPIEGVTFKEDLQRSERLKQLLSGLNAVLEQGPTAGSVTEASFKHRNAPVSKTGHHFFSRSFWNYRGSCVIENDSILKAWTFVDRLEVLAQELEEAAEKSRLECESWKRLIASQVQACPTR